MNQILIVDDQQELREGIRAMLQVEPSLEVAGDLSDGLQVVRFLRDHPVDLILMDIRMPGIDGVETTRRVRREYAAADVRVIVLTTFDQDEIVLAALRAGANGFLSKTVSPKELIDGIAEVLAGGGALSSTATAALIGHVTDNPPPVVDQELLRRFEALTPRERDIITFVASGLSNEEIARQLFLSPLTVKTHAVRAMTKVDARDRAQLVSFAFRAGIYP